LMDGELVAVRSRFFEIQRAPEALVALLRELARELGATGGALHAVTMTAELSQLFRTKREGVAFVLGALDAAFPRSVVRIFTVDGSFLASDEARRDPIRVAAANWAATARIVAAHHRTTLLIDVGSTTTDIIPIVDGRVAAAGRTDPERLRSGELVYTGALRTPTEALARQIVLGDSVVGVSAEGFALTGDVHLWRGDLLPAQYTVPTPDGRPATREFARERLARVVCGDRELIDDHTVSAIADALAMAQVHLITSAIERVLEAHRSIRVAIVAGLGVFLAARAARQAGLTVVPLGDRLGDSASRCAPAAAVALLLGNAEAYVATEPAVVSPATSPPSQTTSSKQSASRTVRTATSAEPVDAFAERPTMDASVIRSVVKLGGGLLQHPRFFDAVLDVLANADAGARGNRRRGVLIVPGGGLFADAVREIDSRLQISDDAAHWMAVLAMDQHAYLVADRLPNAVVVTNQSEIAQALSRGQLPVLAPSRWLREADPLPHSWDVTSDSIAAWIAGALGAHQVILVKPPRSTAEPSPADPRRDALVDRYFERTVPPGVSPVIVLADRLEELRAALDRAIDDPTPIDDRAIDSPTAIDDRTRINDLPPIDGPTPLDDPTPIVSASGSPADRARTPR